MKLKQTVYFAPMEGITGYVYRNAYQKYFHGVDRFVTPFIATNQKGVLKTRDKNDILPEHNGSVHLIPQILTNKPSEFIQMATKMEDYGYREVNLNLGCPSRTVVTKGKGSGFLAFPCELDRFFDQIFSELKMDVSVKTRLGVEEREEFSAILKIFNRYPIKTVMIHPRVQQDYYRNPADLAYFEEILEDSKNPVCYNGDLFTAEQIKNFSSVHPGVSGIMIGRGLLRNPGVLDELEEGFICHNKEKYKKFVDEVCRGYRETIPGDKNVLFKMKEFWSYMVNSFTNPDRYAKKIRKTGSFSEYVYTVERLFDEQEIITEMTGN